VSLTNLSEICVVAAAYFPGVPDSHLALIIDRFDPVLHITLSDGQCRESSWIGE